LEKQLNWVLFYRYYIHHFFLLFYIVSNEAQKKERVEAEKQVAFDEIEKSKRKLEEVVDLSESEGLDSVILVSETIDVATKCLGERKMKKIELFSVCLFHYHNLSLSNKTNLIHLFFLIFHNNNK